MTLATRRVLLVLVALAVVSAGIAIWIVEAGTYDVAATQTDPGLFYDVVHHVMRRSVQARAQSIKAPSLGQPSQLARGEALYREHCLQCHGGPGVAPHPIALGMRPLPSNLAQDGREWSAPEIFWVVKHGVRMSAMPAWQYRLSEDDLWAVTAFVKHLPRITPQRFMEAGPAYSQAWATTSHAATAPTHWPDAELGKQLVAQYMCATCHQIPGIAGGDRTVGPPLAAVADRIYIGGVLRNTPENMVRWLRDPQQFDPGSAMPNLRLSEGDAMDIAAFLQTLHGDRR